jgi:hypothetical protein
MPKRKRFLMIGTITLVVLVLVIIGPGLLSREGPAPRALSLPGSSFVAHSSDLAALRALLHSRGLFELIESLSPASGSGDEPWIQLLREEGDLNPSEASFWFQGELAVSVVEQPPESELPVHQRSPDPRRPWPFRRMRLAWRPEGLLRRTILAWGSQAWFWQGRMDEPRLRRAGLRFVDEGLLVERPSLLLDPETQRLRRPLPSLLIEKRGATLVLTLGPKALPPAPEAPALELPPAAPFAFAAASPWSSQIARSLRGLLDDKSGRVLATLLAPKTDEALSFRVPGDGEILASLDFGCDLPFASLPRPRLEADDLASACGALSTAALLHALADSPSSDPQLRLVSNLAEARQNGGEAEDAFPLAREQLRELIRSQTALAETPEIPLVLQLKKSGGLDELSPGFLMASSPGPSADLESIADRLRDLHRAAFPAAAEGKRTLHIAHRDASLVLSSDAALEVEMPAREDLEVACLRARVAPAALVRFTLDRRRARVARAALVPAKELAALAEQLRRDFAYALKRDPGVEDPELDAMVESRLERYLRLRAEEAKKESRARLDRLAGLNLQGLPEIMLDLVDAGPGRRRVEVRLP